MASFSILVVNESLDLPDWILNQISGHLIVGNLELIDKTKKKLSNSKCVLFDLILAFMWYGTFVVFCPNHENTMLIASCTIAICQLCFAP